MNKNAIHDINILIENTSDIKSSEHLSEDLIKELAKVSKEFSEQKDIEQLWQEEQLQNNSTPTGGGVNATAFPGTTPSASGETSTNLTTPTGGGATNVTAGTSNNATISSGTTSPATGAIIPTTTAPTEGGATDATGEPTTSSPVSGNTTPSASEAGNGIMTSGGTTAQTYAAVAGKQTINVPQKLQGGTNEPAIETVKVRIKEKLQKAMEAKDEKAIAYWTRISKAFEEGATAKDFDGKPDDILFTQMYAAMRETQTTQNFNWEEVRKHMIDAIDSKILNGIISKESKTRWTSIRKQLSDDNTNVANLFEQYDELFLLLKEVEGLDALPNTISITTKTKIYPNLSVDKVYANIGTEAVYDFLRRISNKEIQGSAVNKGGVKVKNSEATSFIVGESLEFVLDEIFINQNKFQKENINWIVYKSKTDKGTVFINEGTSFSYNFDSAATYKVEAYGKSSGANNKKTAKTSAFVELIIVAQEIVITPPAIIKNGVTRASNEEQLFKVALKNPEVKTLNPIKLYYQVENTNTNKVTTVSNELELDPTGIIKLAMPNLGTYTIKVNSKDQYGLTQKAEFKTIKNFVKAIDILKGSAEKDIYLWREKTQTATFGTKSFMIDPATPQEKNNVKWLVYDKNGAIYIPEGFALQIENSDAQKPYLAKGETFVLPIPKKEGSFTIEAYSNSKEGLKSKSSRKIEVVHPKVTEAYWAYNDGNKKKISGLSGEINHIKAHVPGYINQQVRVLCFLNDSTIVNYYNDTTTNENGEVNKTLKFDVAFQKRFGIQSGKTAKIRFELEGLQAGKPYLFKKNPSAYNDAALDVTTSAKITDAYFMYEGNRVTPFTQVPYGEKVTGVVKTLNMVGKTVTLKIHDGTIKPSVYRGKVVVDHEGVASREIVLDKKWHKTNFLQNLLNDSYYVGLEELDAKYSLENGLNAVVANNLKLSESKNNLKINDADLGMIWGGKVSIAFRKKVVAICKDLWGEAQKYEMANALMIAMSVETWETFSSSVITSKGKAITKEDHKNNPNLVKGKAVGLAQFTGDAVKSLILKEKGTPENTKNANAITQKEVDDYKQKLALLSPEEQLDYVKTYFMLFDNYKKVKRPEDIYMVIFAPRATGKGDDVDIYKKYLTEEDRKNKKVNKNYSKNASMDTKNDGFNKGNNDEIIQSGELLARYREMREKGIRYAIDINETRKLNQVLAEKILKSGRVTFSNSHVSQKIDKAMAIDNITDTSKGNKAKLSNYDNAKGGEIELTSEMLFIMYMLSQEYTFNVSEISGASHEIKSTHYRGLAFDINEINKKDVGQGKKCFLEESFCIEFEKKILKLGAKRVLRPYRNKDHDNHFHINV